ncbi:MAG: cell division protein ZapA [Elusimicrobia bacterium]|nr:cell division protein ZapA [Elusimicrobiota bacterium]
MIQEKITVEILGRRYELDIEGLTEIEASALANLVAEKIMELQRQSRVVDTSKLAVLAALNFADELRRLQVKHDQTVETVGRRVSSLKKILEELLK